MTSNPAQKAILLLALGGNNRLLAEARAAAAERLRTIEATTKVDRIDQPLPLCALEQGPSLLHTCSKRSTICDHGSLLPCPTPLYTRIDEAATLSMQNRRRSWVSTGSCQ